MKKLNSFSRLSKHPLSQVGFTLIELLIAISIIVILTTIGIASYTSSAANNNVLNAGRELKTLVRKLRTDAIASRKNCDATHTKYYGTYIRFLTNSSYSHGSACYDSSESFQTNLETANVSYPSGITTPNSSISSPTAYTWKDHSGWIGNGTRDLVIFYATNGSVYFLNYPNSCATTIIPAPSGYPAAGQCEVLLQSYPTQYELDNLGTTESTAAVTGWEIPQSVSVVRIDLTGSTSTVRVNFNRNGLVCEEKITPTPPAASCIN